MLQCQQHLFHKFCVITKSWRMESTRKYFLHKWHHVPCIMTSSPSSRPYQFSMWRVDSPELSMEYKMMDCPGTNINTGTQYPLKFPGTRSQPCTHWCLNSSMSPWKRVCSHLCLVNTVLRHHTRAPSVNTALVCEYQKKVFSVGCVLLVLKHSHYFKLRPVLAAFLSPRHWW